MRAQYPGGAGAISISDAQFHSLLMNLKLLTIQILHNSPVLKTKLLGSKSSNINKNDLIYASHDIFRSHLYFLIIKMSSFWQNFNVLFYFLHLLISFTYGST